MTFTFAPWPRHEAVSDRRACAGFVYFQPRGKADWVWISANHTEMPAMGPIRQLETIFPGMGTIIVYQPLKSYLGVHMMTPRDDVTDRVVVGTWRREWWWEWLCENQWPWLLTMVHELAQAKTTSPDNSGRVDLNTGTWTPEVVEWTFREVVDGRWIDSADTETCVAARLPDLLRGLAAIVPNVHVHHVVDGVTVRDIALYVLGQSANDPLIDVGRARVYRSAGFPPDEARRIELSQEGPSLTEEALRTLGALR